MPEFGLGNEEIDFRGMTEKPRSEYERGKSALAALSLTSRDMRGISQPILYHCFYDDPSQNKTSKFLRTLVAQPRLANCVRVLALPKKWESAGFHEYIEGTRGEIETWVEVSTRLDIPAPRWLSCVLSGDEPTWVDQSYVNGQLPEPREEEVLMAFAGTGPDSRLNHMSGPVGDFAKDARLWQHFLLVGLCSTRLTHLAVSGIYGSNQGSRFSLELLGPGQPLTKIFDFPRLRVFSCADAFFSSSNFPSFFSQAKALNQVTVGHIDWLRTSSTGLIVPTPFNTVRKLSLSCSAHHLADILNLCNNVQDLEFHLGRRQGPITTVSTALYPWPASIKQQIRRLCWTCDIFRGWKILNQEGKKLSPPLNEFQNLEILEIDRVALHVGMRTVLGPDLKPQESSRYLPDFLPPSIRILHFSHGNFILTWSMLVVELEVLAAAKKTSLPLLSVIQIDETRLTDEKELAQVMKNLGVVRAMKDAGIELRFGYRWDPSERSRRGYGMRPYLPGNLHGPIHHGWWIGVPPAENYLLED